MRSAAEREDVGWPDPAAVLLRMLSARSWRARARYVPRRSVVPLPLTITDNRNAALAGSAS